MAFVLLEILAVQLRAQSTFEIYGQVTDPQHALVSGTTVRLLDSAKQPVQSVKTDAQGHYQLFAPAAGAYRIEVNAPGFQQSAREIDVHTPVTTVDIQLTAIRTAQERVEVVGDIKQTSVLFPDPAQGVWVREQTLDANPGRPGAPISIPGLPIETASGGIKAPQYFAPGVAGDHGEPIAQYIQVGSYLVSNNLSANAHGNGYADPNILIPAVLEGVQTDGGAFNVREGNHAENLAAMYELRSRLEPFVTLTGDYRDADLVLGWSPEGNDVKSWVALETAYGNGFLDRLEHRQQYKLNGYREWQAGAHELTLFEIGYYGQSFVPGLVPLDVPGLRDTVDQRQKDQTHTGEFAFNDDWRLTPAQDLQLSSMFRTYNLALYSNFGDGLIRQSEFRTVAGGNVTYINKLGEHLTLMAGLDYQRDAPRRLDLDHYLSNDPAIYGPFEKVSANNVTLADSAPYLALDGKLTRYLHYYAGWRRDEIQFNNADLLRRANSYDTVAGFNSPKATLAFLPAPQWLLPEAALSFGEAFYTNDPRTGMGTTRGTPVSREHAYQLVISKTLAAIDFRLTLGHITTEASLAKIDPDTGLQQDEGPGRNRFLTASARREFGFGLVEVSFSKADARDLDTGLPTPEAPRTIFDALGVVNRLPLGLKARAEYEEVARKPLGDGFVSVPVREFRGALLRSFRHDRMDLGLNFLIASGYTGQTTEVIAAGDQSVPFEQVVGVRLPSYVSLSYTYRFRPRP
ncbi:MAG TPA: TonB-dependent receptor [Bryobacteraceae bacterium]|jgi:hypothetical protein|nr:TonB-dependent receptor [Bryobacteraceae bacterium]